MSRSLRRNLIEPTPRVSPVHCPIPALCDGLSMMAERVELSPDLAALAAGFTDAASGQVDSLLTSDGLKALDQPGAGWEIRAGSYPGYGPDWCLRFKGRGSVFGGLRGMIGRKPDGWCLLLMLGARYLWERHLRFPDGIGSLARQCVVDIANRGGLPLLAATVAPSDWRLTRIDICRDHYGREWSVSDLEKVVAQSCTRGMAASSPSLGLDDEDPEDTGGYVWQGRTGATLYIGRRRRESRFARLYDKIAELMAKGAQYYAPVWNHYLTGDAANVGMLPHFFRLEIEHGAGWLQSHGLESLEKLRFGIEWALWSDYLSKVRHCGTLRPGQRMRDTQPSPAWSSLARPWVPPVAWEYRQLPPAPPANPLHLSRMASGCVANWVRRIADDGDGDLRAAMEHVLGVVIKSASDKLARLG